MERTNGMQVLVDGFAENRFGKSLTKTQKEQICVFCHKQITGFRDALSAKEYGISGICQECQNDVF